MAQLRARPLTAAVIGVALLATACAPGQVESDDPDDTPTTVDPVDPEDFAGETLNYVYFTDGPDEAATRELIADFEAEYDVEVNLEILPFSDLVTSVQARLSGGNAPDVVRLTSLSEFRADLLPLDPYLGADYAEEFLEGPRTAVQDANGQLIAIPSDLTLNGPFINVDLFEEAGVDYPEPGDQWSWQELIDAAIEVQEATGTPYAFALDKSGHRVSTILSQYGTALVGPDGLELDADAAEAALEPLVQLMIDDVAPRDFWIGSGSRYEGANEIFLAQDTPLYLSGNWQVGQFAENATFEWAVIPNPCEAECGGFPGGKFMAAFRESSNPALAAEFIRFMNDTENQATFVSTAGALPTRVDLSESGVEYPADQQEAMDVFIADLSVTPTNGYEANGNPAFSGSAVQLVEEISQVVVGNKELPEAIADLQDHITALVEELDSW